VSDNEISEVYQLEQLTNSALARAKELLLKEKFRAAVAIYNEVIEGGSRWHANGPCMAAVSLGIAFGAEGPHQDMIASEKYYLLAEELGSPLATYYLAGRHHRNGNVGEALKRYRAIAEEDASAAYWAYRILDADEGLRTTPGEHQYFRQIAIRNGHLLARRDEVRERILGRRGAWQVPGGIADYFRLYLSAYRAAKAEEDFLYT